MLPFKKNAYSLRDHLQPLFYWLCLSPFFLRCVSILQKSNWPLLHVCCSELDLRARDSNVHYFLCFAYPVTTVFRTVIWPMHHSESYFSCYYYFPCLIQPYIYLRFLIYICISSDWISIFESESPNVQHSPFTFDLFCPTVGISHLGSQRTLFLVFIHLDCVLFLFFELLGLQKRERRYKKGEGGSNGLG